MNNYLKDLVSFYPVSSDQDAVLQLLKYCKAHFEGAGLKAELLTYDGVHNLYMTRASGAKHVKVLLQSHIDVVPGEGQPYKETEGAIEGRGTFDMLFAAAAYMRLVDELGGRLSELDMGIMLSGDEEISGERGVKAFLAAGYTCDVCIIPDAVTATAR
jgi:acetylornithine deacetylase/succinyl-diaminopimelate desuccinylase-like protein